MLNDSLDQQLSCFAENETSQECVLLIVFQENFVVCYENNSVWWVSLFGDKQMSFLNEWPKMSTEFCCGKQLDKSRIMLKGL